MTANEDQEVRCSRAEPKWNEWYAGSQKSEEVFEKGGRREEFGRPSDSI